MRIDNHITSRRRPSSSLLGVMAIIDVEYPDIAILRGGGSLSVAGTQFAICLSMPLYGR